MYIGDALYLYLNVGFLVGAINIIETLHTIFGNLIFIQENSESGACATKNTFSRDI